ncbi:hypothetical protein [Krasilnikovia sp. M28-CT-15]|uniref:hypothetical protein n=1 Tax=Krasilnikovia sp. M28-CT-15 TaxID=3373540 RepID=UPI0038768E46
MALLGMSHWFFGNLYEAVVFSPNWIVDSSAQMTRLEGFFVNTGPTMYFVPLAMLAPILVWVLLAVNKVGAARADYRRAGLFALLATVLNGVIVTMVVTNLFDPHNLGDTMKLTRLAWQWNILNLCRMLLTAATGVFLFNALSKLEAVVVPPRPNT